MGEDVKMSGKPQPIPNTDTAPFWAACDEGRLVYQRCTTCGHDQFYPRAHCLQCQGRDLDWVEAAPAGEVYSFTVVERAPTKAFRPDAPYVIALIDLADGFRMMMNVRQCPPEDVRIGMPVKIIFERPEGGGQALPQAVPA